MLPFHKGSRSTGHDVSPSVEWTSTAINSSERNQIWWTGGGNWWDHTYPYVCVSVHTRAHARTHTHTHTHKGLGWSQTDIKETRRRTSWQNGRKAAGGCEVTLRRLPGGRANCGDDDEDGNRMVELVRLIKKDITAHLHTCTWRCGHIKYARNMQPFKDITVLIRHETATW